MEIQAVGKKPNNGRSRTGFPVSELYLGASAYQRPVSNQLRQGASIIARSVSLPNDLLFVFVVQ